MITNLRMDLRFKLYSPATTSPALNDTQAPTVTDFLLRLLCFPVPDWGLGWRHGDQGDQVHSTHNTTPFTLHTTTTTTPLHATAVDSYRCESARSDSRNQKPDTGTVPVLAVVTDQ